MKTNHKNDLHHGLTARREMYYNLIGDGAASPHAAVALRLGRTINRIASETGLPEMRVEFPAGLETRVSTTDAPVTAQAPGWRQQLNLFKARARLAEIKATAPAPEVDDRWDCGNGSYAGEDAARAAAHEAGHYVVGQALGMKMMAAAINYETKAGYCRSANSSEFPADAQLVFLAGGAAAESLRCGFNPGFDGIDREIAEEGRLYQRAGMSWGEAIDRAKRILSNPHHRRQLDAAASLLLWRGECDAYDLDRVIRRA